MSIWEILYRGFICIVVAPLLSVIGAVWAALVLSIAMLLTPVACIVTIFFKNAYGALGEYFKAMLKVACIPFAWLVKLIKF